MNNADPTATAATRQRGQTQSAIPLEPFPPGCDPKQLLDWRLRVAGQLAEEADGQPPSHENPWIEEAARYLGGSFPLGHISELTGCTAGLMKWNRRIIKQRFRRDWVCPHNFDHHCYKCPVGYIDCPAATHKETSYADAHTTEQD